MCACVYLCNERHTRTHIFMPCLNGDTHAHTPQNSSLVVNSLASRYWYMGQIQTFILMNRGNLSLNICSKKKIYIFFFMSISHWINVDQNLKEVGTHTSKTSIPALADSAAEISCCQQMCWTYTGTIQSRSLDRSNESSFPLSAPFLSLWINCRRLINENPIVEYSTCGRCLIISNEQSALVKNAKLMLWTISILTPYYHLKRWKPIPFF